MNILCFNQDWFRSDFEEAGHQVITAGLDPRFDIHLEAPLYHISSVLERCPVVPDRIVLFDNSGPIVVTGLEECDIPCVFYSVDIHHHLQFHRYYYQIFDYTFVAQRDFIPQLREGIVADDRPPPEWLPLWASRWVEPEETKEYGAVFVGNLDLTLNPDRVRFFEELCAVAPVTCRQGIWWTVFAKSSIVVNQTVKADLNFRVFEAMISGALLLTDRAANGLLDLFTDREHLVIYERGDAAGAAEAVRYYLDHPHEARAIAQRGRDEIVRAHLPRHRAARMLEILEPLVRLRSPQRFFAAMMVYLWAARQLERLDTPRAMKGYAAMLEAAEKARAAGESITEEQAISLIMGAMRYDQLMRRMTGQELLLQFADSYRELQVLQLARVRALLNMGRRAEATDYARAAFPLDPEETFENAERLVSVIIEEAMCREDRRE